MLIAPDCTSSVREGSMVQIVARQIAILALLNGILDLGRLLGIGAGDINPFAIYSVAGFAFLAGFSVARIFAGVGIWIESNWGTPLLFIATASELVLFLSGLAPLSIGIIGFAVRLAELAGTILILTVAFRQWRQHLQD